MRRAHKYGARPVDGYASTLERDRARELRLLEHAGEIRGLVEQPRIELLPGIFYKPDFAYWRPRGLLRALSQDWEKIHEETKGVETARWRLIQKLWRLLGPTPLRIVKRGKGGFVVAREIVPRGLRCTHCGEPVSIGP